MNLKIDKRIQSRPVAMLLALLKKSLNGGELPEALFCNASASEWKECYRLAVSQGVMALVWDGVLALPEEFFPPKKLKLQWALAVEAYEKRYAIYCHTVNELSELMRPHGVGLMQLKGVGFSACYPIPAHREGGDIDVYFYALDSSGMTDEEARNLAEQIIEKKGIYIEREHSEKHNEFCYNGILIESHKTFLNIYNTPEALPMDAYLHAHCRPINVSLLGGKCNVAVPTPQFNVVFIGFHAAQHYVNGLSLHHLVDWGCLQRCEALSLLPYDLMDEKVMRFLNAFTALANQHLGFEATTSYDEKFAASILSEMLFPPFDIEKKKSLQQNPWQTFIYKTKRFIYRHQKLNRVFTINLKTRFREVYKNNAKNPTRLFRLTR